MKKLLSIILALTLVLLLAACGGNSENGENTKTTEKVENKGEKITLLAETWEGDDVQLSADFYYPKDAGITLDIDEENPSYIDMHYESKNITISPALFEDTTFDANKDYAKENEETYKEFKIGKYNCYGYEDFSGYWIYVHLEEVSETTDRYIVIETEVTDYSKDAVEGIKQYEDEDIKKIVESFVYNGVVKVEASEEAETSEDAEIPEEAE